LVCPYLFDLEPTDLIGPLVQFNAAKADEEDTRKLVLTINEAQDTSLPLTTIQESFELWWPRLQEELARLPAVKLGVKKERPEREILEELLELVRGQVRSEIASINISELLGLNEAEDATLGGGFVPGEYVHHGKYGRGLVLRREGKGDQMRLTVSFPGYGQKKLIQKYAKLSKA